MNILELLNTAHEIGKSLEIKFSDSTFDYTIHGKSPREISPDYFLILRNKYDEKLHVQLKNKPKQAFFDKVLYQIKEDLKDNSVEREHHFLRYGFLKVKNQLTDDVLATHNEILAVLDAQHDTLDLMQRQLVIYAELSDFIIDRDFVENTNQDKTKNSNITGVIKYEDLGRATFNLGKKEVLMLFYALEKSSLLKFDGVAERNKFIEANFNYVGHHHKDSKDIVIPVTGVVGDMQKLNWISADDIKSNNRAYEKLLDTLKKTICLFEFKR